MEKDIKNLYKQHDHWIRIVMSFGSDKHTAEDIVQEMYIKIILKIRTGLDIKYNEDEINYYYIFRTLNGLFIDLKRKGKNIIIEDLSKLKNHESDTDYEKVYEKVQNKLERMYWYDKKVFEIINDGESIASLSRKTHIAYHSLYNTYTKVKKKLKQLL
tara:strand:+ start:2312 stop:2785 length:474 start_codon:yes stop_codon:yes gene_type:complete